MLQMLDEVRTPVSHRWDVLRSSPPSAGFSTSQQPAGTLFPLEHTHTYTHTRSVFVEADGCRRIGGEQNFLAERKHILSCCLTDKPLK